MVETELDKVTNSVIRNEIGNKRVNGKPAFSANCLYLISGSLSFAQLAIFRARMT